MRLHKILEAATKHGKEIKFGRHERSLERYAKLRNEYEHEFTLSAYVDGEPAGSFRMYKPHDANKAIVSGVFVYGEFQRQRVGEALYREGAKWMAENGLRLYASTNQTADAEAMWRHLDQKGLVGEDEHGKYVVNL